jgi:glycosyltransferase involved in cell wall biosynthesis
MRLVIIENHQPLPVKTYGGIERISLFHFQAQCEIKELDPVLICLDGSTVKDDYGTVITISPNEMAALLSSRIPLDIFVKKADIVLTNNSEDLFPINLGQSGAIRVCVCHGDFREQTNNPIQIFLTRGQLASHKKNKPGFSKNNESIYVVPNGINPDWYSYIKGPKNKIVWLSSIDDRKSPHLVGRIADSLARVVVAAGNGDPKKFNSDNVKYLGVVSSEGVKNDLFSHAEVYIHTAQNPVFNDPCPTTVLEAQMCGVPVVGLKSGGVEDIVYDKTMIFDNIDEMIACLRSKKYLEHSPEKIRQWCIDNHSHLAMAARYNECFKKIRES